MIYFLDLPRGLGRISSVESALEPFGLPRTWDVSQWPVSANCWAWMPVSTWVGTGLAPGIYIHIYIYRERERETKT